MRVIENEPNRGRITVRAVPGARPPEGAQEDGETMAKVYFDDAGMKLMRERTNQDRSKKSHRTDPATAIQDYEFAPHYTRGYDEVCVFGEVVDGLHFDYSDRLSEWDRRRSSVCWKRSARKGEAPYTANRISRYLSYYFNKPTVCKCIIAGVNRGNGWDYRVYGYVFVDEVKP